MLHENLEKKTAIDNNSDIFGIKNEKKYLNEIEIGIERRQSSAELRTMKGT